ncbi:MAG: hypothetical protein ACRDPM_15625, partial [Solirubrobacteraceae bacterium]
DHYRVGDVVAYRSMLLHVLVLHRIIAISGGRYEFKGDHNNFIDPTRPTRAELVGALWIHLPGGGTVFRWLHSPVTGAVLCALVALLLVGTVEKRRRGRRGNRGNGSGRQGAGAMTPRDGGAPLGVSLRSLVIGFGTVGVVSLAVGVYAITRPAMTTVTHKLTYTQKAKFTYHATAPVGPVYPSGTVSTGDPVFLQLVHRLGVKVAYRFAVDAPSRLHWTQQVFLDVTGPSGWTRTIALSRPRRFTGTTTSTTATIDVRGLQSLLLEVEKATGISGSGATIVISLKVHVTGTVAGQPVAQTFSPNANFQLQPLELLPGGGAASAGATPGSGAGTSTSGGFDPNQTGSMTRASTVPSRLVLLGHTLALDTLMWIAIGGAALAGVITLMLAILLRRNQAFDEAARIRARYSHLLVPILVGEDLGWPPIDVTSIKALVRLAESSGQLILHHQADAVDTYLVNDNGTVYRYQIKLPLVTWGDWTETNVAADPAALADVASALADVADAAAAPMDHAPGVPVLVDSAT